MSGPFSEKACGPLAFVSNKRDGYVDNRYLGTDDSDTDNWSARGFLQYQPSESLELLVKVHAGRNNSQSKRNKSEGLLDPAALAAGNRIPCETTANIGTCSDGLGYIDSSDSTEGNWNRRGDEDVDSEGASVILTWIYRVLS